MTQSAFILHAAWLGQTCVHCPIFPTAASRRSRVRVSVPVWGVTLSRPLKIVGLVSRYLTNYLILRTSISVRRNFNSQMMPFKNTIRYYSQFPKAMPKTKACYVRVTHPCATNVLLHPFDLHVLSLPLAFILSQDQTLHSNIFIMSKAIYIA